MSRVSDSGHQRRADSMPGTIVATAATKATLRLALIRLNDQLDTSERILEEEREELVTDVDE